MYLLKRLMLQENQRINHTGYDRNDKKKKPVRRLSGQQIYYQI